jgi:hypothetical protein
MTFSRKHLQEEALVLRWAISQLSGQIGVVLHYKHVLRFPRASVSSCRARYVQMPSTVAMSASRPSTTDTSSLNSSLSFIATFDSQQANQTLPFLCAMQQLCYNAVHCSSCFAACFAGRLTPVAAVVLAVLEKRREFAQVVLVGLRPLPVFLQQRYFHLLLLALVQHQHNILCARCRCQLADVVPRSE